MRMSNITVGTMSMVLSCCRSCKEQRKDPRQFWKLPGRKRHCATFGGRCTIYSPSFQGTFPEMRTNPSEMLCLIS